VDDLVVWLLEQVAEDENAIRTMIGKGQTGEFLMSHRAVQTSIIKADSSTEAARFRLAECESKRRIISEVVPKLDALDDALEGEREDSLLLLRLLALPYADRAGYREEWKP
jgi:hypothetical protein